MGVRAKDGGEGVGVGEGEGEGEGEASIHRGLASASQWREQRLPTQSRGSSTGCAPRTSMYSWSEETSPTLSTCPRSNEKMYQGSYDPPGLSPRAPPPSASPPGSLPHAQTTLYSLDTARPCSEPSKGMPG